ncbi:unnamed protein product [Prorocentrum cordatum]|uniref:Uncharacterized protein n=1 Tax=Prorocentrum cordatum TaxID=2364126 RepID=A0ABN9Q8U6_9DINO|nr:unnamed protein product [Polarella glacialis]
MQEVKTNMAEAANTAKQAKVTADLAMKAADMIKQEDSKAPDIVKFMEGVLAEAREDVEETFAYGKGFAERGGARFKTSEAMWKHVRKKAGQHVHKYNGQNLYCNTDYKYRDPTSEDAKRERAVRMMVRKIVEVNGDIGAAVKYKIDTNYFKGIAWFKDERVAAWVDGKMDLVGAGMVWKDHFEKLYAAEVQQMFFERRAATCPAARRAFADFYEALYKGARAEGLEEQELDGLEEQRIFRNGRGCDDAAHVLRTVVEKSAERGGDLRLAALDVEKAIGKVHHDELFDSLLSANIDVSVVKVLRELYLGTGARERSCGQAWRRLARVAFAGDVSLVARSWLSLERMALELRRLLLLRGLCLRPTNCEAQTDILGWARRGGAVLEDGFSLQVLEKSECLEALGRSASPADPTKPEIDHGLAFGWREFWALKRLPLSPNVSINRRLRLFDATAGSAVLHGSHSWTPRNDVDSWTNQALDRDWWSSRVENFAAWFMKL